MISQKLINLIEQHADELTRRLMKDLLTREETKHYRNLPEDRVYERVHDVYSRLDLWLSRDKAKTNIRKHYTELGRQRYREGIPCHEVMMAFMLIKKHLWLYIVENQIIDSSYECQRALELNNRVILFFDRVIFFSAMGYEEERAKQEKVLDRGGFLSRIFKSRKV
ncbi:MAG: hypothetical protein J7L53_06545 [Deltaproteobacteria bacterium]|nr:hypothetical protein [Deltaproteobacteria bacterium]